MPHCIVLNAYTTEENGTHREWERNEVTRLSPRCDLIVAGYADPIADSDMDMVAVCSCGRSFWGEDHPHFAQEGHRPGTAEKPAEIPAKKRLEKAVESA